MDYIIALMNYYGCFNGRGTTKSNGKKKLRVMLSGKITVVSVTSWLIFAVFFAFFRYRTKKRKSTIYGDFMCSGYVYSYFAKYIHI